MNRSALSAGLPACRLQAIRLTSVSASLGAWARACSAQRQRGGAAALSQSPYLGQRVKEGLLGLLVVLLQQVCGAQAVEQRRAVAEAVDQLLERELSLLLLPCGLWGKKQGAVRGART